MENIKIKVIDFFGTIMMWLMMYIKDIFDTILTVGITYLICLLVTKFFFMPVQVSGSSMHPTLYDKSYGFSNIVLKKSKGIERFDIVVIDTDKSDDYLVKRVIGLPNETITFIGDNLYINGEPFQQDFLDEEYVQSALLKYSREYFTNDFTYTLSDDEYFCLGDNRIVSIDSRNYGPFSSEEIIAIDIYIVYPFSKFGLAE